MGGAIVGAQEDTGFHCVPQFPRRQDSQPTQSLGKQNQGALNPLLKYQAAAFLTKFNTKRAN